MTKSKEHFQLTYKIFVEERCQEVMLLTKYLL